ncbi:MAG: hypothetical protein R3C03_12625 [Pirellulaceae bacterium]
MVQKTMLILVAAFVIGWAAESQAQILFQQTRSDYQQPTTYGPEDPNFRSRLFREHTGHSGWFYNCDGEEDKRFSPYIQWQTVDNSECVRPWGQVIRCDLKEVFSRVRAGACCGGPNCHCSDCQTSHNLYLAKEDEQKPSTRLANSKQTDKR